MKKEIQAKLVVKNPSEGAIVTTTFWPIAEIEPNIGKDPFGKQTYDVTMFFRDPCTCEPLSSNRVNFLHLPTGCNYAWMIAKTLQTEHPKWTFTWDYDNLSGQITIETDKDSHNDEITTHKENKTMPRFTKVVVNGPATIAWVTTGRNPAKKVVIKKADGDVYDLEKAMLMCWAKSWFSDDTDFHKWFRLNMKMFEEAYEASKANGDSIANAYPGCYNGQEIANNINNSLDRLSERLKEAAKRINSSSVYGIKAKEKQGVAWSWDEVSFLNRHYSTKSVKHIATVLGRSEAAVRAKARKLGIKRGGDTNDT